VWTSSYLSTLSFYTIKRVQKGTICLLYIGLNDIIQANGGFMEGKDIASIVLSSITIVISIFAIIISIISYKNSKKNSNAQLALSLYESRMKIYKFYCDCMDTLGGLKFLIISRNLSFNFQSVLNIFNTEINDDDVKLTRDKLTKAQKDDKECFCLITIMFGNPLKTKLLDLFNSYSELYTAILYNQKQTTREADIAFKKIYNIADDTTLKNQFAEYLDFSNYKIHSSKQKGHRT